MPSFQRLSDFEQSELIHVMEWILIPCLSFQFNWRISYEHTVWLSIFQPPLSLGTQALYSFINASPVTTGGKHATCTQGDDRIFRVTKAPDNKEFLGKVPAEKCTDEQINNFMMYRPANPPKGNNQCSWTRTCKHNPARYPSVWWEAELIDSQTYICHEPG